MLNVTGPLADWVDSCSINQGLLTVFIRHTSASLTIQENADPDVLYDLEEFFGKLVPQDGVHYRHNTEGKDDMPAHIKSALTNVQLTIPVMDGKMALGIWQGIYIFEHRAHAHKRSLALHLMGK